jgi:cell division protein FtsL
MSNETKTAVLVPVAASVISSIIVGMAAAYLTAQTTIAVLSEKVAANRESIDRNTLDIKRLEANHERLVRVETKIDVLLASQRDTP